MARRRNLTTEAAVGTDRNAWQHSWDRQQERLPDREERFRVMLAMVDDWKHVIDQWQRWLPLMCSSSAGCAHRAGLSIEVFSNMTYIRNGLKPAERCTPPQLLPSCGPCGPCVPTVGHCDEKGP
ncbi:hypothetical protein [Streptomyces sp. URMC 124]|uniref:hypothetical protein n=1 Tax=Streptomyces sp. URMC 124 TaxID=3423405 RepID=UPI003F1D5579